MSPITDLFILVGVPALTLIWLAYVLSATWSLKRLRQEAEQQTALLEKIAEQTRPPGAAAKKEPSAVRYPRID